MISNYDSNKNINIYLKNYTLEDYNKILGKMIILYNKCSFFPELNGIIGKIIEIKHSKSNLSSYILTFSIYKKNKFTGLLQFVRKIDIDSNMNELCYNFF